MTYDDYGHINPDPKVAALTHQIGPKSVITFPSGGQQLSGPGFYEITGLAWSGAGAIRGVEISTDGGQSWKNAELRSPAYPMAHTRFGFHWKWDGKECVLMSRCTDELGTVQPTRADVAKYWNATRGQSPGSRGRQYRSTVEGRQRRERSQWACLGFSSLRRSSGFARLPGHSRPPTALGGPRARKKSAPGISPSARREKSSRQGRGLPRKARCSMSGRGARDATGQRDPEAMLPR